MNDEVILKERNSDFPWSPSDFRTKNTLRSGSLSNSYPGLSHRMFLGHSLKNNVYPLEDTRNLGFQVIDMEGFIKDNPSYVRAWKNSSGEATFFSYATFDRYTSNSSVTKNVSGGFKLNLGLFSIGNKNTLKSVFTTTFAEDKNTTFGELNIMVRDSCYQIQTSSNILEKIRLNYLSNDYKDELYNTHPSEFFTNYGGFVLSNYVMGGKATAMYAGTYKKTETNETKEKNLNSEINASYGFSYKGSSGSASGDLNLGRSNTSGTSVTNEFSSIMMSIKTIGGNSTFASFSVPKEVKNTSVDLSSWMSSISDKSTHSIVEFGTESLIPITDFIVERNLRNQIRDYYSTGINTYENLKEPKITIDIVAYSQPQVYVLGTFLHTRFGNKILLKSKFMGNMLQPNFMEIVRTYLDDEANRVTKMFGVRVTSSALLRKSVGQQPQTYFDFDGFDEDDLGKVTHKGVTYIVSNYIITKDYHPLYGKKFALSIHNDRFINEYAMRDFINRLPTINISYEELIKDYTIDAL
jgi:hypothetical protein